MRTAPWQPQDGELCGRMHLRATGLDMTRDPSQIRRSELEQDRKWVVEHHSGDREIIIERTDPKHTVYIYNCHNSVIQVCAAQQRVLLRMLYWLKGTAPGLPICLHGAAATPCTLVLAWLFAGVPVLYLYRD